MKIALPQILRDTSSLPSAVTLAAASATRKDCIITLLANGPYYVKRGPSASSTNFTWLLSVVGQTLTIENYNGIITVDTDPGNDINVAIGWADAAVTANLPH